MNWTAISEASKALAAALGALATLGYVTGYLVLRARAHALGISPPFDLVDEVYVFAGFRFLVSLLLILMLTAPVLALAGFVLGRIWARFPTRFGLFLEWLLLGLLGLAAIMALSEVLGLRDILFVIHDPRSGAAGFFDPRAPDFGSRGLAFEIAATALIGATAIRLHRIKRAGDARTALLGLLLALQAFLLPVLHGALRADHVVPVLRTLPEGAGALVPPALIVDRNGSVATLFGFDAAHEPAVVVVPAESLLGLTQGRPVDILDWRPEPVRPAMSKSHTAGPPGYRLYLATSQAETDEDGFVDLVVTRLRRLLDNLGSLSNDTGLQGRLMSARLGPDGQFEPPAPFGPESIPLRWPVADRAGMILALREHTLVRVEAGDVVSLDSGHRWGKLLGILDSGEVIGLLDPAEEAMGAIRATDGTVRTIPLSPPIRAALLSENVALRDGQILEVNVSARGGRGLDVYLVRNEKRGNLSHCGDALCVQPFLSPSADRVLFIKALPDQ